MFNGFYCVTLCVSVVFAVARCLSVCPSRWRIIFYPHGWRYRQTSFSPGSPITLVFWFLAPIPNSKGNPFSGVQSTLGWEKFAISDRNHLLSRKRYEIGPWLLLNAYRKSYALYRMMTFSLTFTDPYPGFLGHSIFYVKYIKNFFWPPAYGQVTI